ncbi:MAG: hypothetical protein C5B51_08530 [Terriglobia bacterium]|nr:MAG: hypothetical protein C5B51_08530 [Terriglobia bacterium]
MIAIREKLYRKPRGLLAVVLLAAAGTATVHAQTPLQADVQVRPLTRDEISAYKLPSTLQVSAGLTTVGLGEPAYLDATVNSAIAEKDILSVTWTLTARPAGSAAVLSDSPLTKNVPLFEPSDAVVSRLAGRSLLRPDVAGAYVVTARIATLTGGTADVGQTIIAGTYMGRAACTACHSGGLAEVKAPTWSKTAHASIFTQGMNGVASDHYGTGCLACHTVGYDATAGAVNGGFDDVAKQLNWVFPTTLKAGTFDTLPMELKNLGNIQCENCHGPGSQHVRWGGSTLEISVASNTGVCSQCHAAATHHIKSAEWNNSMHAVATRDPSGAGREACVGCHTGTGFVDRVNGAATPRTAYSAINCQTCHEPHGQTTPGSAPHLVRSLASVKLADGTVITEGGNGKLCMNCHQSRQNASVYAATAAASARFGPHHGPQADMLQGANGFTYSQKIPSSAHIWAADDSCVTCHMQTVDAADPSLSHVGGHTFKPSWTDADNKTHDLVAACQGCHGPNVDSFNFPLMDYDGDGVIDGVQTEVQHLLDKLALLLPPAGQSKDALTIDTTWTRAQLEAGYNWQFVKEDKSLGIHNTAYAVGLLKASIADLGGPKK